MNSPTTRISNKVRAGWILLAAGLFIVLGGMAVRFFYPAFLESIQWIVGLGLLFLGISVAILASYLPALRSSQAAARQAYSETDERNVLIRNAAGYIAFIAAVIANYVVLYAYSSLTRGTEGIDAMWYALTFLALFPIVVFIIFMVRYQKKM